MEALKAIKIIGNQNDGIEGLCFYFFRRPGNKGFSISCATPNWRIFLLEVVGIDPRNVRKLPENSKYA